MYLTRATLRRDVSTSALRALLAPKDKSARIGAGHRLVWSLFADAGGRERDFLWRETDGVYHFLSRRVPEDRHGLFELCEPRSFEPDLAVGDRLQFSLRANATVARKSDPRQRRGKPCDVVMDAIYRAQTGERADARRDAVATAGLRWLAAQGDRCGFNVCTDGESVPASVRVTAYRTLRIEHAGPVARIGVLDFDGLLEVCDPDTFAGALRSGFGRAKAFGCGLMLIRRVPRVA